MIICRMLNFFKINFFEKKNQEYHQSVKQFESILSGLASRLYKALFMLNSTGHEFSTTHKIKILTNKEVSCIKSLRCYIYHANKC